MNYLVSRLYKSEHISIANILQLWQQLNQEIEPIKELEPFDSSIWKIWQTTEVFSDDTRTRIYSVSGHWQPLWSAVKTSPCYLRTKQVGYGTAFTIISTEREALGSVQALIENIYHPVEPENLDRFFDRNKDLLVQSASIYEDKPDGEVISNHSWSQPITLGKVLGKWSSTNLLSISATVNIPIATVKVGTLSASKQACQVRLSVETEEISDLREEQLLMNGLFKLADRIFDGKQLTAS